MKLTLCLIVKNEEKYLERCLKSLYEYVDEIIITDTGSKDNTVEITKKYTQNIHHFEWIDDFSAARNYCHSFATGDYILWMDADEWFDKENIEWLKKMMIKHNGADMFSLRITHQRIDNKWTSEDKLRIIKNNNKYRWYWKMHEIIDTISPNDMFGQSVHLANISFNHTLSFDKKNWVDLEYFENHFEGEKENNTVSLWLMRRYLWDKNREKIMYIIENIPLIHWQFHHLYTRFLYKLTEAWHDNEAIALKKLIKKSLVVHRKRREKQIK